MRLLWALAHGLESASKRMNRTIGVTGPQRLVVRLIGHYGRLSPGDLSRILFVHPSSLTGVLGRLERARLISRRADPHDARRAILELTARGKRLNARHAGTVEALVRRTLSTRARSELEAARDVLAALADELERSNGAP